MANYIKLYDPVMESRGQHKCDLPNLRGLSGQTNDEREFCYKSVIECGDCAKRWFAEIWVKEDKDHKNKWKPLKWYHVKLLWKVWRLGV
jgi:hypothetical protein